VRGVGLVGASEAERVVEETSSDGGCVTSGLDRGGVGVDVGAGAGEVREDYAAPFAPSSWSVVSSSSGVTGERRAHVACTRERVAGWQSTDIGAVAWGSRTWSAEAAGLEAAHRCHGAGDGHAERAKVLMLGNLTGEHDIASEGRDASAFALRPSFRRCLRMCIRC
jgi:hypothetical protein